MSKKYARLSNLTSCKSSVSPFLHNSLQSHTCNLHQLLCWHWIVDDPPNLYLLPRHRNRDIRWLLATHSPRCQTWSQPKCGNGWLKKGIDITTIFAPSQGSAFFCGGQCFLYY